MKRASLLKTLSFILMVILAMQLSGCGTSEVFSLSNVIDLLKGLGMTLLLIVSTLIFGYFLGYLFFLGKYYSKGFLSKVLSKTLYIFSLTPLSTWILICYYIIIPVKNSDLSFLVATFALTVSFAFHVFSCFVDAKDQIPSGEMEAALSMGYNKKTVLKKIMLPQMMPTVFDFMNREAIVQVRDTSLVGFIMVQDIQTVADRISIETGKAFFPIILTAICYILLSFAVSQILKAIARKYFPSDLNKKLLETRAKKGINND